MTNFYRMFWFPVVAMALLQVSNRSFALATRRRVPFLCLVSTNKRGNYTNPTDNETSVPIPPRKYGYRTLPLSWSELEQIIVKDQDLARLSRSIEQERNYELYKKNLLREYRSVYDHVLHSKFGFNKRLNKTSELWETNRSDSKAVQVVLVPNDFPYYTEIGIEHWVLWKLNGAITDAEIQEAKTNLTSQLGDVMGLIHWENPPHLKSLPDIDHIHILVRRKANEDRKQ